MKGIQEALLKCVWEEIAVTAKRINASRAIGGFAITTGLEAILYSATLYSYQSLRLLPGTNVVRVKGLIGKAFRQFRSFRQDSANSGGIPEILRQFNKSN